MFCLNYITIPLYSKILFRCFIWKFSLFETSLGRQFQAYELFLDKVTLRAK